MERFDPYTVLGVPPSATRGQIKRAYRRAALQCHPDKNPEPEALERFHRIQRAYEILRRRRRAFDTFREDAARRPPRAPADWFRMHRRARRGPPPAVHGEGDRAYVRRPDYRTFTWMGVRFRNTETAHGRIALVLAAAATLLVLRLLEVPFYIGALLLFGIPLYLVALVLVLLTSRWGVTLYPWNAPLPFEPGAIAVLVSADDGPVPLHRARSLLADTVAVRVRPGTIVTVEDVRWHPNPAREVYRVRTGGGRSGWVRRENLADRG